MSCLARRSKSTSHVYCFPFFWGIAHWQKDKYTGAMLFGTLQTNANQRRVLHALHLFYAGFFALVLPFICWGAQATPGHPHGLAHFVFTPPSQTALAATAHLDAAEYLATFGQHDLCSTQRTTTPHQRATETPQLPPGRSTPSLMVSLLLMLVAVALPSLSLTPHAPFHIFYGNDPPPNGFAPVVPTPPPR